MKSLFGSQRWSSFRKSKPKDRLRSESSRSERCVSSSTGSLGISFGKFSAAGKYHENEDRVISGINLNDVLDPTATSFRRTSRKESDLDPSSEALDFSLSDVYLSAVFDGHGGDDCSQFMVETLPAQLAAVLSEHDVSSFKDVCSLPLISEVFGRCEESFQEMHPYSRSGSCAAVALVHNDSFLVSWLGDCRAVMYSGGNVLPLTTDHRTSNKDEVFRITQAGGEIINGRVMGVLSPTRAFGDNDLKRHFPNLISVKPGVLSFSIEESEVPSDTSFLIIASDGVFDGISNQRACEIVSRSLEKYSDDVDEAAKQLVLAATRTNSDDASVCIILWDHRKRLTSSPSLVHS